MLEFIKDILTITLWYSHNVCLICIGHYIIKRVWTDVFHCQGITKAVELKTLEKIWFSPWLHFSSQHLDSQSGPRLTWSSMWGTTRKDLFIAFTPWLHQLGVTPVPSTVSPMVGPIPGFTAGSLLSPVTPTWWNHCARQQFVLSTIVSLYLDSQLGDWLWNLCVRTKSPTMSVGFGLSSFCAGFFLEILHSRVSQPGKRR